MDQGDAFGSIVSLMHAQAKKCMDVIAPKLTSSVKNLKCCFYYFFMLPVFNIPQSERLIMKSYGANQAACTTFLWSLFEV